MMSDGCNETSMDLFKSFVGGTLLVYMLMDGSKRLWHLPMRQCKEFMQQP